LLLFPEVAPLGSYRNHYWRQQLHGNRVFFCDQQILFFYIIFILFLALKSEPVDQRRGGVLLRQGINIVELLFCESFSHSQFLKFSSGMFFKFLRAQCLVFET
jgi:hypothetical protein